MHQNNSKKFFQDGDFFVQWDIPPLFKNIKCTRIILKNSTQAKTFSHHWNAVVILKVSKVKFMARAQFRVKCRPWRPNAISSFLQIVVYKNYFSEVFWRFDFNLTGVNNFTMKSRQFFNYLANKIEFLQKFKISKF